jgi:hypothetical protein
MNPNYNTKMSKNLRYADYDPFATRTIQDKVGFGVKGDRVDRDPAFKGKFTPEQIGEILTLGAPTHNNFTERISQAEKDALKEVAKKHYIQMIPDLNSKATAQLWIKKKYDQANLLRDPKARKAATRKWEEMGVFEQDLDADPSTPDNLIIRNKNDVNDLYAIDGLRYTDRKRAMVNRGVFDMFTDKASRRDNKELIDKLYKKYLRKYIKPEDRVNHPFNENMVKQMDVKMTEEEPLFQRITRQIRYLFSMWGITIKDKNGDMYVSTPHYGYLSSKVASDYYRYYVLPDLVKRSAWANTIATRYPQGYNFFEDPEGLLKNKAFRDSMLYTWKERQSSK